jgi:hypothetical protein
MPADVEHGAAFENGVIAPEHAMQSIVRYSLGAKVAERKIGAIVASN